MPMSQRRYRLFYVNEGGEWGGGGGLDRGRQFPRAIIFLQPQAVQIISNHSTYSVVLVGAKVCSFFTISLCRIYFSVISQLSSPPYPHTHQWNYFLLLGPLMCTRCVVPMPHIKSYKSTRSFLVWKTYLFWFHGLFIFQPSLISRVKMAITKHCFLDFRCLNLWRTKISLLCVFSFLRMRYFADMLASSIRANQLIIAPD